jgi:hypothetical protein
MLLLRIVLSPALCAALSNSAMATRSNICSTFSPEPPNPKPGHCETCFQACLPCLLLVSGEHIKTTPTQAVAWSLHSSTPGRLQRHAHPFQSFSSADLVSEGGAKSAFDLFSLPLVVCAALSAHSDPTCREGEVRDTTAVLYHTGLGDACHS